MANRGQDVELALRDSAGSEAVGGAVGEERPGDATASAHPWDPDDEDHGEQAALLPRAQPGGETWAQLAQNLAIDVATSVVFWYIVLWHINLWPPRTFYAFSGVLGLTMLLWRLRFLVPGAQPLQAQANVPYTCGVADVGGKTLYLVATLHISPRAPRDVEAVIQETDPHAVMIELDEERLDRMRGPAEADGQPAESEQLPDTPDDLQLLTIKEGAMEPLSIMAQRAYWNAEWSDQLLSGAVVFDENDRYGLSTLVGDLEGKFRLVYTGAPAGESASALAMKVQAAADGGARALLIINSSDTLPRHRLGAATPIAAEMTSAIKTCNCGFPPLPALLLPQSEGNRLQEALAREVPGSVTAEFRVLADTYPRRTLRRRLGQGIALVFSGIGILYGIIECFAVEVGGEFLAAERIATARHIPCLCIDVDLDGFWSRLGAALLPTPYNLLQALLAWLAFPRVLRSVLFPPMGNVDVIGSTVLHLASLPLKTWIAYLCAGYTAGLFTSFIMGLFSYGAVEGAEASGAVEVNSAKDRSALQDLIMLCIELYLYPRVYEAVAASRDEAMYQGIVDKSSDEATRIVVVAGAAHINGILSRLRSRGL